MLTERPESTMRCAEGLLSTAPKIMQALRENVRQGQDRAPGADLSVPQLRLMLAFRVRPGATLSQVAADAGLALSSASRLLESLGRRGLLTRRPSRSDRRRLVITLTEAGEALLGDAHQATLRVLGARLGALNPEDLWTLERALRCLRRVFADADGRAASEAL